MGQQRIVRPWAIAAFAMAFLAGGCASPPEPAAPAVSIPAPLPPPPVAAIPARVDHIVVRKAARELTLFAGGQPVRTITGIQLGDAPVGPKRFQGDERTPEGRYTIDFRNPQSAYHLSLRVSYPSAADRGFAARSGRSPGGDIFIHGQPNGFSGGRVQGDWTDGCIAVSNGEMEELWRLVTLGTTIDITP